jgi:hypothetical protein
MAPEKVEELARMGFVSHLAADIYSVSMRSITLHERDTDFGRAS